ncbi:MAG: hypothetical protein UV01_C0003G0037 [Parcubacteria group bacterium GW2011_GWA2_42_14]|nr:MAG: hypothetical protein UV01_C0003G0037 [Parcubacteria group bacterium GW2011_GWA2_42_14]OHA00047.1 MAG: hypothetical protein A3D41_03765 [Candidatus Sungbacteria bacterium RIFCSPHIGHO2_02_FULL_41_12b]
MDKSSTITIIDEKNLRGVLAPPEIVSKETLENLVDFIELSNPEISKETEKRVKNSDRKKTWIPAEEVERRLKKRLNLSKQPYA